MLTPLIGLESGPRPNAAPASSLDRRIILPVPRISARILRATCRSSNGTIS